VSPLGNGLPFGPAPSIVQAAKVTLTSGDLTTTSTSFVDVTGLAVNLAARGFHRSLVIFSGNSHVGPNGSFANASFDLAIDGSRQGGSFGLTLAQQTNQVAPNTPVGFTYLTNPLDRDAHTFKIQWKVDAGGTGTLFASTSVTPAVLTVLELGI
jgi:hypothetical protein